MVSTPFDNNIETCCTLNFQTWLDERLFGWSRSTTRERDVLAGSAKDGSDPMVDLSDDEIGDYDDLLGYLDGKNAHGSGRSRSERNSYADLQKLRRASNAQPTSLHPGTADMVPNPSLDEDGLRIRVPRKAAE